MVCWLVVVAAHEVRFHLENKIRITVGPTVFRQSDVKFYIVLFWKIMNFLLGKEVTMRKNDFWSLNPRYKLLCRIIVTTYAIILFDITCQRYAKLFRKFLFFPNNISRKEFDSPIWDGSLSNLLFRTSSQTKLTKSPKIEPGSSLLGFSNWTVIDESSATLWKPD